MSEVFANRENLDPLVRARNLLLASLGISLTLVTLPVPGRHCPQNLLTQIHHLWSASSANSILFLIYPQERLLLHFPFIRNMISFRLVFPVEMNQRCRGRELEEQVKYLGIHFCCDHLCCGHLVCGFSAQNRGYRKSLYSYWEVTTQWLCKSNYCRYLSVALGLLEGGDLRLSMAMEKQLCRLNVNGLPQPI